MEITEKWLQEAGGWQAMKRARTLAAAGAVLSAEEKEAGVLVLGVVQEGKRNYRAGLRIRGATDVDNLCTCPETRRTGALCAHSLAVGLTLIQMAREPMSVAGAGKPEPAGALELERGDASPAGVILPPNLASAWQRGQTAIRFFEPETALKERGRPARSARGKFMADPSISPGGSSPGHAPGLIHPGSSSSPGAGETPALLEPSASVQASPARQEVRYTALRGWLRELTGSPELPAAAVLDPSQAGKLFRFLTGQPHVFLGNHETPVRVTDSPFRPRLRVDGRGEDEVVFRSGGPVPEGVDFLMFGGGGWALARGEERAVLMPFAESGLEPIDARDIHRVVAGGGESATRSLDWFLRRLDALEAGFEIARDGLLESLRIETGAPGFVLSVEGSLNHLAVRLDAVYPGGEAYRLDGRPEPGGGQAALFRHPGEPGTWLSRDPAAEARALDRLRACGFSEPDRDGFLKLSGEPRILRFFASGLPGMQADWDVTIGERFGRVTAGIERVRPVAEFHAGSGEDWFSVDIAMESGSGGRIDPAEIQRLLRSSQSHHRLANGKRAVVDLDAVDDLNEVLRDSDPDQTSPGCYNLPAAAGDYLRESILENGGEVRGDSLETAGAEAADPGALSRHLGDLAGVLRDYQEAGVRWMASLAGRGLGGILADEMGLGKTLQSLALLRALREAAGDEAPGPSLVVCPSTLIENWRREAEKFVPEMDVLVHHGAGRADRLSAGLEACDTVLTSYALLRRDIDDLAGVDFAAVILDEGSHIRNPKTHLAKAASRLRANFRFVLTGTPVENSVRDLWSIFRFLLPGYLGGREDFQARYELPIATGEPGALRTAGRRLQRRIRPFFLRRTKREVASELPEKLQQVVFCEMTDTQESLYRGLLDGVRSRVDSLRGQGEGAARMAMLTALLRLRQVCCDPRLLEKDAAPDTGEPDDSAKLRLLRELLREAVDGGHRVLVFSQFVRMLRRIRHVLEEEEGLETCYLDGQTRDRFAEVERFQTDAGIPVFLISLKAGGYGLTLTEADTVMHFDPWWNPAVEAQATDRVHRIGQTRPVTAYKLITRGTVEEKILNLQQRKQRVIDFALDEASPAMGGLTTGEIEEILGV